MPSAYSSSPSRKSKWPLKPIVGVLAVLLIGYFLWNRFFAAPPAPPEMPPAPVSIEEVQPEDIALTFEYAGRTAGSREVEIRARVSGILQKRAYVEGQAVKQGDVLFKIDPAPFTAALAQAQARLNQTSKDWERAVALRKEKALSPREYDEAQAAYEGALAAVRTARINLDYTTVRSPVDGITSREGFSEGSLVVADTSLLTRVSQLDPMYVDFAVPEAEALRQREYKANGSGSTAEMVAEIRLGDGSTYGQKGAVNFTDSIIDPATGTVSARAVFPNADHTLLPGLFVRVYVSGITMPDAVVIPDQAIMQGPQGAFVYTLTPESTAAVTPVEIGDVYGDRRRIITAGLKAGDNVITEGMIKVRPGAPVEVRAPQETPPGQKE